MTKADIPRLDKETRDAISALASRVRHRDIAEDPEDAESWAAEFVLALRGQGWRPTPARPSVQWQRPIGRGATAEAHADELAAAKAACEAAAAKIRAAGREGEAES